MPLLVSVRSTEEAAAALEGGADVIDAKDPAPGSLGSVAPHVFRQIRALVGHPRPVTAAIGDPSDGITAEPAAREPAGPGPRSVKVGFLRIANGPRITE